MIQTALAPISSLSHIISKSGGRWCLATFSLSDGPTMWLAINSAPPWWMMPRHSPTPFASFEKEGRAVVHYDQIGKKNVPLGVAFELTAGETPADLVRRSSLGSRAKASRPQSPRPLT